MCQKKPRVFSINSTYIKSGPGEQLSLLSLRERKDLQFSITKAISALVSEPSIFLFLVSGFLFSLLLSQSTSESSSSIQRTCGVCAGKEGLGGLGGLGTGAGVDWTPGTTSTRVEALSKSKNFCSTSMIGRYVRCLFFFVLFMMSVLCYVERPRFNFTMSSFLGGEIDRNCVLNIRDCPTVENLDIVELLFVLSKIVRHRSYF